LIHDGITSQLTNSATIGGQFFELGKGLQYLKANITELRGKGERRQKNIVVKHIQIDYATMVSELEVKRKKTKMDKSREKVIALNTFTREGFCHQHSQQEALNADFLKVLTSEC
jgi:hypothetical protein